MKRSLLALAVSFAAVSGAHAAWDNGSVDGFFGNGELLLAVWDVNNDHKVSVAQDLGDRFTDYEANLTNASFAKSYTLDAAAFSVFATSNAADLRYAVIAISNGQFNTIPSQVLATTNAANPTPNSSDIGNVINASVATAGKFNKTDVDYTLNKAVVGTPGTNDWAGDNGVFGSQFTAQSFPFNITANLGTSLAFYEFNSPDLSGVADVKAVGQFSLDLQSGTLNYAAATAPAVPVPAAAWLMGSALVGLGSIARRRRPA
jgi:hypothetical protein